MNNSVILLSGGLDSLVALDYAFKHTDYNVTLALTFDYGQRAREQEIAASKKIALFYNIEHKVICLDWLKKITKTALISNKNLLNSEYGTPQSASNVWVPNRNALFLNIAACYCDSNNYNHILYGANKDEGKNFPDNTEQFRQDISRLFETSTLVKPVVVAPLINYSKDDIVRIALEDGAPLEYVYSCYSSGIKHCGKCESCYHLKKALISNHREDLLEELFE